MNATVKRETKRVAAIAITVILSFVGFFSALIGVLLTILAIYGAGVFHAIAVIFLGVFGFFSLLVVVGCIVGIITTTRKLFHESSQNSVNSTSSGTSAGVKNTSDDTAGLK